jgi:hypothetical protein
MGNGPAFEPRDDYPELLEIQITLPPAAGPRRLPARSLPILGALTASALVAMVPALGGLGIAALFRHGHSALRSPPAMARFAGPAGVAAAYGYPIRCLSITIPPGHATYARADFDRRNLCGRYMGYTAAIFHRTNGTWRVVLEASAYVCPVAAIPPAVQARLGICPGPR